MEELTKYTQYLEKEISRINFGKEPRNLFDPLRYFLALGGKRIRPVLTLLSGDVFQIPKEESIHAALCIELFHNFSLIHDDIMDEAPVRRGKATVHTKWNSNIAILSGDVLFVEAYQQLANYTDTRLPLLLKRFNETAVEVCRGQQLDMDFESRKDVSEAEYIEMIRLKTSVLLGCALEFGAILANREEKTRNSLYQFGVSLGIAFQIQDDILDLYGDPELFGKQVGGDILSNKKTLLFLKAKDRASKNGDSRFGDLLKMNSAREKITFAKSLFEEIGARQSTIEVMNLYYQLAIQNLKNLEEKGLNVSALFKLSAYLMHRNV
ncbi:polyprenyl synthetase family protein [Fluviicola sp.]|jgi:geranylgeranyl diphosphate synthase type II|uniref:polyprenyl synthetase family protein n=1 Tax=Fluviicola sp. TaxID=1917219 RepID=UPI00282BB4A3|nr:polyprenyl synthetase family protein [Fluviicola sp.]MDR0803176.1 polyprenyl synthetase family protein [Fluviicola sp.]